MPFFQFGSFLFLQMSWRCSTVSFVGDALKSHHGSGWEMVGSIFMFFSCSQYENGIRWRPSSVFRKALKAEALEHVNLVYDIHFVFTGLWRQSEPVQQAFLSLRSCCWQHPVRGCWVKRRYQKKHNCCRYYRASPSLVPVLAVDRFGKNAGTGCFYPRLLVRRIKRMRQLVVVDGIFQSA